MLPTFIVVGAMKSGTTSLYEYLRHHPQVFMPGRKELDFFVEQRWWNEGVEWYERWFDGAGDAIAIGEASPDYTKADIFKGVPGRMASVVPEAKIIYVVRHPLERMRSQYLHEVSKGRESRPIDVALREHRHYFNTSRYSWQLDLYLAHFPRQRIKVVLSEDLRERRGAVMRDVFDFIGVDLDWNGDALGLIKHETADKRERPGWLRSAQGSPVYRRLRGLLPRRLGDAAREVLTTPVDTSVRLSDTTTAALTEELAEDVARLRDHLGDSFDGWGLA